jgi:tetratricopeptide (TPR) repeat protein
MKEIPSDRRTHLKYYLAASVSLITFLVYLPSLQNEFISRWDDGQYILNNVFIRSFNINLFKKAFFGFYAANWHPLTWISHAVDCVFWGLNPVGHHLTNNILHTGNTFIVVLLAARLVEAGKVPDVGFSDNGALIAAATTGILFGVHPLHVESVAWVSERKDLLCGLFFLLSVMTYLGYATKSEEVSSSAARSETRILSKYYLFSLAFFILALLSKPMAVSLPVVLLVLDWYPLRRIGSMKSFRLACIEKLPFVAFSFVSSILAILAQKAGGAMEMNESVPFSTRLLVAAESLVAYLWKIVMPVNLSPYYPYPKNVSLLSWQYLSAVVLALGITAACMVIVKKRKVFLSAWGYYVVTLIPVSGIVQVGGQAMADRYMYLPSIGPFLLLGLLAAWAYEKARAAEKWGVSLKIAAASAFLFVFIPMGYLTVRQITAWKNDIDLWSSVIAEEPTNIPQAYTNRGLALYDTGRIDLAIDDFSKALAVDPGSYEAYNFRGSALDNMGQPDKAIADFDKAIALNPRYAEAYYNRGISCGKIGLLEDSIKSFDKALELDPNKAEAYVSRGVSYARAGRNNEALEDFNKAILLNSNNAMAYFNRANFYSQAGNKRLAESDFQIACDLGVKQGCDSLQALLHPAMNGQ